MKEGKLHFLSENLLGRSKRDAMREKMTLKKLALSKISEEEEESEYVYEHKGPVLQKYKLDRSQKPKKCKISKKLRSSIENKVEENSDN